MNNRGRFIAFEGIDGSGKSTQVRKLANHLTQHGHQVYTTFEPTDSPIGKIIRAIFNHQMEGDQRVIAALFAADRLHHLLHSSEGMIAKLEQGHTVITDRYYLSSYAYHSVHNIDLDWIISINAPSAALLKPDLNIYIDISPETGLKRLTAGRTNIEMYETLDNLTQVKNQYEKVFEKVGPSEKIAIVDGNKSPDKVFDDVLNAVLHNLEI
ncbi:MAG: dTMP kinase [Saprospiraceae bacterium]|nr:dTMP kinase [Saprospiraceae bacterium]